MVLKKKLLSLIIAVGLAVSAFSLEVPALKGRVNDYAGVISSGTEKELENFLFSLEQQSGIQMVVLTVPSLKGDDIASFGIKVAEKWQIGRKGKDDGAILLVAMNEHDVRIEVGYGLEGTLTDAKCGLIIRNVIIPEFKNGNYSAGILKGIKNMGGVATGDMELVSRTVANENDESNDDVVGLLFVVVWMIFFFIVISSKGGLWKWFFISRMFGGSHSHSNHRGPYVPPRNSGFGGGLGGGSFHGGGGHFGGGGASGHW